MYYSKILSVYIYIGYNLTNLYEVAVFARCLMRACSKTQHAHRHKVDDVAGFL